MLNKITQVYRLSNLKLHYPKGFAKIFKIPHHATTSDIVQLIKQEEQSFQSVKITMGDKDMTDQQLPFVDLVLHNTPSINIDDVNFSFELDLNGCAPYYMNSELETAFGQLEIPYFDALVIARFHELMVQQLNPNKQSHSPVEIESAIQKALAKFAEENATSSQFWQLQSTVLQNLDQVIVYYEKIVAEVTDEATKQGHKLLKQLIVFALIQYFFLLYLTYGIYDWGVSEPISYLMAQVMETVALFYFIKKGRAFKQTHLFKNKFDKTFYELINKKTNSTYFMKDLEFAKLKADLIQAKVVYGTTSV
ncbi:unnamed protein product (macronuclear) [Paramecium tetraurelia]|uniref:Calcium uniporter protein C-terminal domain-containing protein n=1 Tax=Paramecium tetraurelia TaxID=5888 RepID=A0C100_PARTE|nr:uncharacterized protein GSPATT00033943001 [Paramecium tetraurelia]CAK64467.1 unnamed protein product [Paramecium tetraurelia]|eukprot:XP_001431865.1 hypothetical protein (macronuclear) [Paramecium tetraurelia strain d4-2]